MILIFLLSVTCTTFIFGERRAHAQNEGQELRTLHFKLGNASVISPELPLGLEDSLREFFAQYSSESYEVWEDLIMIFATHPEFDGAEIFEYENTFFIEPLQYPRLVEITFNGLKSVGESEALRVLNLNLNEQLVLEDFETGKKRLQEIYQALGFYQFRIEHSTILIGKQMTLVVNVSEGSQIRIGDMEFLSENQNLNQLLPRRMRSFRNKRVNDSVLEDFVRVLKLSLVSNKYYQAIISQPRITFSEDRSKMNIQVRIENPYTYGLLFEGNRAFNQFRLIEALEFENFSSNQDSIASELTLKLKAFYLSKGYSRAEILFHEEETAQEFSRRITFKIEENALIRIEKLDFRGRFSETAKTYEDFILSHSTPLLRSRGYNKEDFELGLSNFILDRQNQGFLQAKVNSWRIQYNRDRTKMTIVLSFDEGPLTQVSEIRWSGTQRIPQEELTEHISLRPDEPLRLRDIEASLASVKNYYFSRGFIEMKIENEDEDLILYNEDGTMAAVHFRIFEGPQVFASSIVIEGNGFTKEQVIRNELEFSEGDILTPEKLDDSIARLQRTGFFSSVQIRTLEDRTLLEQRTVIVRVTERDPGSFTIGLGATNDRTFTIRGYTGVGYRNLWGTGRGVSLRLEGNYNVTEIKYLENRVTVSYLEPYIFGSRIRGKVGAERSNRVSDFQERVATERNQYTYTLERDFGRHILAIYDLWSFSTLRDFDIDNQNPGFLQEIGTTGPAIEVDYRDNPFNPTSGFFTRANYEYSSPDLRSTRTIHFYKANLSMTHYNKMSEGPWVWANQVRLGFLENVSPLEDGGVPYDKVGFVLGGRSTIRGFVPGGTDYFPRLDRGNAPADKYFLTTRAKMYLVKSEIRMPLYGNIGMSVFYDGGGVLIDGLTFRDSYRDAAGLGLRYNTPFGAVSAEYGMKLDRHLDEPEGAFYLSIGSF